MLFKLFLLVSSSVKGINTNTYTIGFFEAKVIIMKAFETVHWKSSLGNPTRTVGPTILQSGFGSREEKVMRG